MNGMVFRQCKPFIMGLLNLEEKYRDWTIMEIDTRGWAISYYVKVNNLSLSSFHSGQESPCLFLFIWTNYP